MSRFVWLLTLCLSASAFAGKDDNGSLKDDFRSLGHAFRDAGKQVGKASVKVSKKVLNKADDKMSEKPSKDGK
jgi:hypothetical protein